MGGQRSFNLAVVGSGKEKGKEELKVLGQARKKMKALSGRKRSADAAVDNLFKKRRQSIACEEVEQDNVSLELSKNGKYPQSVIKAEDWSVATRELRPRKHQLPFAENIIKKNDEGTIIGTRVKVFWPLDDDWYAGTVESFDRNLKRHHIVYDDGDEEWLELARERFKIQLFPDDRFRKASSLVWSDKLGVRRPDRINQSRRKVKNGKRKSGRRIGKLCSTEKEKVILAKAMDCEEVAKMLILKKTAPRSKRARIAKQFNQKHSGQNLTKDVNCEIVSANDGELLHVRHQDAQDVERKIGLDANLGKIDGADGSRQGERQSFDQVDNLLGKEINIQEEISYTLQAGKQVQHSDDKESVISTEVNEMKSEKQIKKFDKNEQTEIHVNQLDTNLTPEREFSNQGCQFAEDKTTVESRPNLTHYPEEMQPNVEGIYQNVCGKQAFARISNESVNEKLESSDMVNIHGKSQGIVDNLAEKHPYGISNDEKEAENQVSWDLDSVLGNKHGIRRQRSVMKIRLRDSISATDSLKISNGSHRTLNWEYV
ncbi:hypothetical protein SUGI_0513220 [Cryptomeria japonica]|nr:hypothetical protein SUGI_0513220 [Cryptomeria japonica]